MPGEQIDRSALAVDRVRDLRQRLPAEASEPLEDPTRQSRVALVHQPIKVAASPTERDTEIGIERRRHRLEEAKWHSVDLAAFDPRYPILRRTRPPGHIGLSPAEPMAQRPESPAEPGIVHAEIVRLGAYRRLTYAWRAW